LKRSSPRPSGKCAAGERIALDTNIYVSAFEFGGGPMRLLQMGMDGEVEVAVSQPIIYETMRVLKIKFGWSDTDLHDALPAR
jgi:predicted nucleic acid-binding protein